MPLIRCSFCGAQESAAVVGTTALACCLSCALVVVEIVVKRQTPAWQEG